VRTGLIDEYQLLIHPVALGSGLPLFSALSGPADLKLVSETAFDTGAVAHIYRPACLGYRDRISSGSTAGLVR
jgi:dihydrofolate reductase